jgi:hypothetical protein
MTGRSLGLLVIILALAGCSMVQQPRPSATDQADSLPRSPKGYELYSWYDTEASEWIFVLITGTNWLKTYEEMVSGESQVTGDGWVSLSARGSKELKALLTRLPSGEQVTWVSRDWLQRVGQEPGDIRLPGEKQIREVEGYCRQRGLRLEVVE